MTHCEPLRNIILIALFIPGQLRLFTRWRCLDQCGDFTWWSNRSKQSSSVCLIPAEHEIYLCHQPSSTDVMLHLTLSLGQEEETQPGQITLLCRAFGNFEASTASVRCPINILVQNSVLFSALFVRHKCAFLLSNLCLY